MKKPIKIRQLRLIINVPYGINSQTFLTFSLAAEKNLPLTRGYFSGRGQLGTCVSRRCRCGEVAVRGGSTVILHAASY